jgi:nitrogen-specific signal transduction histidine kinase/trans-aconitate methyltransferase
MTHTITRRPETLNDITEKKKLEEQLRYAQKLEALGTLAGGVAHDFNNILTAISGYGGLIKMNMPEDDPNSPYIKEILSASDRAAHLTQSLLIFSRKQTTKLKPLNVNKLVSGMKKMMLRLIGEDIETNITLPSYDLIIMGDHGQMEQVLMNFVTNARDAMPNGGTLTVSLQKFDMDDDFVHLHGFGQPGQYALITVSDTGCGMDETTKERIFEPFFTTKSSGKGTGLGLSIVFGIIQQHNGHINCYSEPGKGTAFKVYLPVIDEKMIEMEEKDIVSIKGGKETILVADDDESIRKLIKELLEKYGYTVIETQDGIDAVNKFQDNKDRIELLLLDVVMPKKSGKEAYDEIAGMELIGMARVKTGDSVLDIGCGTGRITLELARLAYEGRVVGIDPSFEMLDAAKKRTSSSGNISLINMQAQNMDFSGEFNLVFSNSALQWVKTQEDAIARAYRALKPGGRIAVQLPAKDFCWGLMENINSAIAMLKLDSKYKNMESPWRFPLKDEFADFLKEAGFKNINVYYKDYTLLFESVNKVLEWGVSAPLRPYLTLLNERTQERFKYAFAMGFENYRTDKGIEFGFRRLFAFGEKNKKRQVYDN